MKLLVILIGLLKLHSVQAQDININEWQSNHPEVIFIEQNLYVSFTEEQQNTLGQNIIVFDAQIQVEDIEFYQIHRHSELTSALFEYSDQNAALIKNWLGQNSQVEVIRSQEFDALTSEDQSKLIQNDALILTKEYLTLDKVAEYEANH